MELQGLRLPTQLKVTDEIPHIQLVIGDECPLVYLNCTYELVVSINMVRSTYHENTKIIRTKLVVYFVDFDTTDYDLVTVGKIDG